MIKNYLRYAIATAFLASGTGNLALAQAVCEPVSGQVCEGSNDSFSSPQQLAPTGWVPDIDDPTRRMIEVLGAIGVEDLMTPVVSDIDYYSFQGRAGDVVTIDIDGGFKGSGVGVRSLDSLIAIFGPNLFNTNDDADTDDGSIGRRDARLDGILLPRDGFYTVGVTSAAMSGGVARTFLPDGSTSSPFVAGTVANGSYKLVIKGVSPVEVAPPPPPPPPAVVQINIDIKPGTRRIAKIKPKSRDYISVALLSSKDFDARKADPASVRFGPTGVETGGYCGKEMERRRHDDDDDDDDGGGKRRNGVRDVNRDGFVDVICRFEIRAAGFDEGDDQGKVKGMAEGKPFEGKGWLKVLRTKKRHYDDHDHDDHHHGRYGRYGR